ncbi:MAG: hypothetical protein K0Q72_1955, partial [Armatimonadetes bacterium]|nr:hypothetical protein [Armatimonadota bacterium]
MRACFPLLVIFSALPGLAAAQVRKPAARPKAPAPKMARPAPKEELAYVRRWFGTVRAVVQGSGSSAPARDGSTVSWSVDRRAEAQFTVEMPDQVIAARASVDESIRRGKIPAQYQDLLKKGLNNPVWFGKLTESVMPSSQFISESRSGRGQGLARSGSLGTKGREAATLTVDLAKKTYNLDLQFPYEVQGQEWTESSGKQVAKKLSGIQGVKIQDQPITSATVLSGRAPIPDVAINHFKLGSEGTITGYYEWLLTPRPYADVELVIKDSQAYRDFIPKGTADGVGTGNALVMEVELQGGEPGEKLDHLIFRLDNGSREPGASINSPAQPPQQELLDLRFGALENPTGTPVDSPIGAFEIRFEKPARKHS